MRFPEFRHAVLIENFFAHVIEVKLWGTSGGVKIYEDDKGNTYRENEVYMERDLAIEKANDYNLNNPERQRKWEEEILPTLYTHTTNQ